MPNAYEEASKELVVLACTGSNSNEPIFIGLLIGIIQLRRNYVTPMGLLKIYSARD